MSIIRVEKLVYGTVYTPANRAETYMEVNKIIDNICSSLGLKNIYWGDDRESLYFYNPKLIESARFGVKNRRFSRIKGMIWRIYPQEKKVEMYYSDFDLMKQMADDIARQSGFDVYMYEHWFLNKYYIFENGKQKVGK